MLTNETAHARVARKSTGDALAWAERRLTRPVSSTAEAAQVRAA